MRHLVVALLLVLGLTGPIVAGGAGQSPSQSTPEVSNALVNLNSASAAQLESLPGVGTRTAERILEYRQQHGGFKRIEDLMNVRGIGEKNFLKLKPLITVTPPKSDQASQVTKK